MTPYWVSKDGRRQLYCGNALDLLPNLERVGIDALISDPPYGIAYKADQYTTKKSKTAFSGIIEGDTQEFDPAPWIALNVPTILWGGNNFSHRLPPGGWLCWDKRCSEQADKMFGSPFELAWCSLRNKYKLLRCQHGGVVNADGHGIKRVHPTQKPIKVMEWCMRDVLRLAPDSLVLDPYGGSGTTGVACIRAGYRFIGVEIEEKYCAAAVKRLEEALNPLPLFAK